MFKFTLALLFACQLGAQNPAALSEFFEGKQVLVKLDMPGTQQGVDLYPQRPQPLDVKSYSGRMKKYGTSLRNGDTAMITKVKVKDNNIEFQLGGGGYGTAFDDTDTSVHFTPSDKSDREKDLENQIKSENDPDRRRDLQRDLDDVRAARERRDRRDRAAAQDAADSKRQQVDLNRQQGGSRFNLHFDKGGPGAAVTPQAIMAALSQYVSFPPEAFPGAEGTRTEAVLSPQPPPPAPVSDPLKSLKKGLTRAQVEALFGQPIESHDDTQNGLKVTSCKYQNQDATVQAYFVNGVLVQYTLASR